MLSLCFLITLPVLQYTYLPPRVDFQDFLGFVLSFLKRQQLVFVALQLLFLQSDHDSPAGSGSGPPQQTHRLGHGNGWHRQKLSQRKETAQRGTAQVKWAAVVQFTAPHESKGWSVEAQVSWGVFKKKWLRSESSEEESRAQLFFHSTVFFLFFFYCRMCIHSISSESVCDHGFMFRSLHGMYAHGIMHFPGFVVLWEEQMVQLGLTLSTTYSSSYKVHCDHRVQSKCPNTAPISQRIATLWKHIFSLWPHLLFLLSFITIHRTASFFIFSLRL